jgi:hypothetical protein
MSMPTSSFGVDASSRHLSEETANLARIARGAAIDDRDRAMLGANGSARAALPL